MSPNIFQLIFAIDSCSDLIPARITFYHQVCHLIFAKTVSALVLRDRSLLGSDNSCYSLFPVKLDIAVSCTLPLVFVIHQSQCNWYLGKDQTGYPTSNYLNVTDVIRITKRAIHTIVAFIARNPRPVQNIVYALVIPHEDQHSKQQQIQESIYKVG